MARFFLPSLFPDAPRILYLDNDVVVSCCIDEVFDTEFSPSAIVGLALDDLKFQSSTQFQRHYNNTHPLVIKNMRRQGFSPLVSPPAMREAEKQARNGGSIGPLLPPSETGGGGVPFPLEKGQSAVSTKPSNTKKQAGGKRSKGHKQANTRHGGGKSGAARAMTDIISSMVNGASVAGKSTSKIELSIPLYCWHLI